MLLQPPPVVMDYQIEQLFHIELKAGEVMRWSAAPSPARLSRRSLPLVLFGIPWTAFALFWVAGASGFKVPDFSHGAGFFPLFGLPFIVIGIGMLSSPYWIRRQAKQTGYFITNQRALILERKLFGRFNIRSFLPSQLDSLERNQLSDGSGDIIFDREVRSSGNNGTRTTEIGFFGIPDVRNVESLLTSLIQQKSPRN